MTTFGDGLIIAGELMVEVDPDGTGNVAGFECGPAIATVEVPPHVSQYGLGMGVDKVGVDKRGDHWTSRSASAAAWAKTSRSGRPSAAAAAAASSYSTLTLPSATLARTT